MSRSDRFKEAYDWLDKKGIIKKKKQLATMMGYDRSVVSNAYNGNDGYANEKFLAKFCEVIPGVFNYEWLVTGEGQMLVKSEEKRIEQPSARSLEEKIDELLKQNAELITMLKDEQELNKRLVISIANEMADMKVALHQLASGQPVQHYSLERDDVNPVNLNDPLKNLK